MLKTIGSAYLPRARETQAARAHGTVDYGNYNYVEFDDLNMTTKLLDPADSGSAT
jgi:hypothetical protein